MSRDGRNGNKNAAGERRAKLTTTLSLALEEDLHLSVDTGDEKTNALIDMMRLQFVDIIKHLNAISVLCTDEERADISRSVRNWLNSLNAAPLVPLSFRLRTLKKLENHLEVLARDMGGLILRAYKTGIIHVQHNARSDPELFSETVHVAATALDLAVRQLYADARRHFSHNPVDIRQSLDIARLGLAVAKAAPAECREEAERL